MAFRYPLDKVNISQGFGGNAAYYKSVGQSGHNGIDLAAPHGAPVFAADDGVVAFEGWGKNHGWMLSPAGICILINHEGSYGGYAHLSSTVISKGQHVSKGQLIGYVGATGQADGPHLHFEMFPLVPNFQNGFAGRIDPMPYIVSIKNATDGEIHQAYREILERPDGADAAGLAHYRKYPLAFVRDDLMKSQERRDLEARKAQKALLEAAAKADEAKKAAERKAAEEAAKKAQAELDRIAAEEEAARKAAEAKAGQYEAIIRENNTILKQILQLLNGLVTKFNNIFK